MAKAIITKKVTKITIEFEDSEETEYNIEKNQSCIISIQNGFNEIPGRFNEINRKMNGLKVCSILIGPEFIINPLNYELQEQITMSINSRY